MYNRTSIGSFVQIRSSVQVGTDGLARRRVFGFFTESTLIFGSKIIVSHWCCLVTGVWRIKGDQATFNNSQQNNLRSCVWVSVVVFHTAFFSQGKRHLILQVGRVHGCSFVL